MKKPASYFIMLFILLFTALGFIFVVFSLEGAAFAFELVLLIALMFLLSFGMFLVYNGKTAGWGITAIGLLVLLLDVWMIFLAGRSLGLRHIITAIFAFAGFIVALANILAAPAKEPKEEDYYEKQYYHPLSEKAKEETELKKEEKISAVFTPGKYVASKKGGAFHIAKCDWAKRVSKENQIWFNSKEEAEAKGLRADRCVV